MVAVGWGRCVRAAVGTGLAVDGRGSGTALGAAGDGVERVSGGVATDSVVPVGALTKMLVRPGSEPVQPAASAIRDSITAVDRYPCLVLKG